MTAQSKPIVLCFSGHDASGGAGIHADIETIASLGAHACTVVTALTVQNTQEVHSIHPVDVTLFKQTIDCLLEDIKPSAIKIGLIGSADILNIIVATINKFPDIPVILDPVLASGSGNTELAKEDLIQQIINQLIPLCTLITPNTPELKQLSKQDDNLSAANVINQFGTDYLLVTGTHGDTDKVHNELYYNQRLIDVITVSRLPDDYHGSGCTVASAISALLAFGLDPLHACKEAIDFTYASLQTAFEISEHQKIPNRMFWADTEE